MFVVDKTKVFHYLHHYASGCASKSAPKSLQAHRSSLDPKPKTPS
jgi:hypothetical protein